MTLGGPASIPRPHARARRACGLIGAPGTDVRSRGRHGRRRDGTGSLVAFEETGHHRTVDASSRGARARSRRPQRGGRNRDGQRQITRVSARTRGATRGDAGSDCLAVVPDLGARLTGLAFSEVAEDASPRGEKLFALWNPPLLDAGAGARRSANAEAATLMARLAQAGTRTIAFAKSRKGAELIARFAREQLEDAGDHVAGRIESYRAGYLPEE